MPTQTKSKNYSLGHKSQPKGKSVGVPSKVLDSMPKGGGSGPHKSQPKGHSMGIPTEGTPVKRTVASSTDGTGIFKSSGGLNRSSGVAGAHRIGCKK